MNLKNKFIVAGIVLLTTVTACRKIEEDNLVKGLWQVESISIDTLTLLNRSTPFVRELIDVANANNGNYLYSFLDGYAATNAYYRIDYQRDGIVFTYYTIGDSSVYSSIGKWELPKANEIEQKVDRFWDGSFKLTKDISSNYTYQSESNYIKFLNDTVSMTAKIKKVK